MADAGNSVIERLLGESESTRAMALLRDALRPLIPYMDDPQTQEIMVNAPGDIWIERAGRFERPALDRAITAEDIRTATKALAAANDKDHAKVLDCRMPGFRIAAAMPPVAINGPTMCIRKHSRRVLSLDDYLASGSFEVPQTKETVGHHQGEPDLELVAKGGVHLLDFFVWMIGSYRNFLVAGSTGSGKTTFINALLSAVPEHDRVLTIEDTAELKVTAPNRVMFEANQAFRVSIRDLVKLALRFRPDRILVGEVRGPETFDLLDALNTGHSGGGASIHANSPEDALLRLENLVRMSPESVNIPLPALRQQIASTIHYVVYCSRRNGKPGPRRVIRLDGISQEGNYLTTTIF